VSDRGNAKPRKRGLFGLIFRVGFAMIWAAMIFAALVNLHVTNGPLISWVIVVGIGAFGLERMIKSVIVYVKQYASGETIALDDVPKRPAKRKRPDNKERRKSNKKAHWSDNWRDWHDSLD